MNQIKATDILRKALELLWDGVSRNEDGSQSGETYACHTIAHAYALAQDDSYDWSSYGQQFVSADQAEIVVDIQGVIVSKLGGFGVASSYLEQELKWEYDLVKFQAFRKNMLEDILLAYEAKEWQAALLKRQIEVLEQVKVLRVTNPNRSNYVCDNINTGVAYYAVPKGLGLRFTPEATAICEDIAHYIDGDFSMDVYMGMDDNHIAAEPYRIAMIDTLIARYQSQLEAM